jgi:hypothetical protein
MQCPCRRPGTEERKWSALRRPDNRNVGATPKQRGYRPRARGAVDSARRECALANRDAIRRATRALKGKTEQPPVKLAPEVKLTGSPPERGAAPPVTV